MPKYKTGKKITNRSEGERRFDKIMKFHISECDNKIDMTSHELELAKKFFMIGWHQSLLSTLDLIESKGEK